MAFLSCTIQDYRMKVYDGRLANVFVAGLVIHHFCGFIIVYNPVLTTRLKLYRSVVYQLRSQFKGQREYD